MTIPVFIDIRRPGVGPPMTPTNEYLLLERIWEGYGWIRHTLQP
jgi:hypothetical protein